MTSVILIGCFTPLIIIFIIIKLSVWVYSEKTYVAGEKYRVRTGYVEDAYADVDAEEEEYGDRTDYR